MDFENFGTFAVDLYIKIKASPFSYVIIRYFSICDQIEGELKHLIALADDSELLLVLPVSCPDKCSMIFYSVGLS
mgnify:CR=1 FL=1